MGEEDKNETERLTRRKDGFCLKNKLLRQRKISIALKKEKKTLHSLYPAAKINTIDNKFNPFAAISAVRSF